MHETDIMPGRAALDPAVDQMHAGILQPLHRGGQVIHPQSEMMQGWSVDARSTFRIQGPHQVDLHGMLSDADGKDLLLHVLPHAAEVTDLGDAEQTDPEMVHCFRIQSADGDLLHTQDPKWPSPSHGGILTKVTYRESVTMASAVPPRIPTMMHVQIEAGLAVLEMRHAKKGNPFSFAMTRDLTRRCQELEADPEVRGVLLWGGEGRSFSVGGDFADVKSLATREEAAAYLKEIVHSYQAVLAVTKPLVCAIDHFAIGQGLQVALLGDRRIGSARSTYHMPELANGVACPLGSTLLEAMLGRAAMLELVIRCPSLDAEEARAFRLIDQVLEPNADLKQTALQALRTLMEYGQTPFRETKRIHNRRLIAALEDVMEDAAAVHASCLMQRSGEAHFERILGKQA